MRASGILREAWRNIVTGTARTGLFAALLTVLSAGLVTADLLSVRSITTAAEDYQAAGASVVTIAAVGRIDGTACAALARVPGVRSAGAVRTSDSSITAAALPSSTIPVTEATQGFPDLLNADLAPGAGVVLSDQAADALGLTVGDALLTTSDETRVVGVYEYPTDGRRAGYGYTAVVPVPVPDDEIFDECWVDVWPASARTRTLLQTTLLAGSDEDRSPVVSQLNTTLGASFDGNARYADRVTRHAAPLALALGAGLGCLAVRSRRIQLASALHAGVRKSDLGAVLALEITSWVAPAAIITASVGAVFAATGGTSDASSVIVLASRIGLAAVAAPYLGAAAALLLTREQHLFRYFKDR